jgi:hypothetical protein
MSAANVYGRRVLEAFNWFAAFKRMEQRMWLMIEEISHQVDTGDADGLQAKCVAVMPFFDEFCRVLRDNAEEQDGDIDSDPKALQLRFILAAGAAGFEPAEIRRRWLLMLPKARKECSENGRSEAQTRPVC